MYGNDVSDPTSPVDAASPLFPVNAAELDEAEREHPWTLEGIPEWQFKLRALILPKKHRAILKSRNQKFSVLSKDTDLFEHVCIVAILGNMVILALDNPMTPPSAVIESLDWIFGIFFVFELLLRCLLLGPRRYFKRAYRTLDAAVVVVSFFALFFRYLATGNDVNVGALRAARVFRAFRTFTRIPRLRTGMIALSKSMGAIVKVASLLLVVVLCISVTALAGFSGKLRYRCVNNEYVQLLPPPLGNVSNATSREALLSKFSREVSPPMSSGTANPSDCVPRATNTTPLPRTTVSPLSTLSPNATTDAVSSTCDAAGDLLGATDTFNTLQDFVCGGRFDEFAGTIPDEHECNEETVCYSGSGASLSFGALREKDWKRFTCPYGYTCLRLDNPEHGIVGFDNMLQASLTTFVMMTLCNWGHIMYDTIDAMGTWGALYATCVVIAGSFFILNLVVAMIVDGFTEAYDTALADAARKLVERARARQSDLKRGVRRQFFSRIRSFVEVQWTHQLRLEVIEHSTSVATAKKWLLQDYLRDRSDTFALDAREDRLFASRGQLAVDIDEKLACALPPETDPIDVAAVHSTCGAQFRRWVHNNIVQHLVFKVISALISVFGLLVLSIEHYNQSESITQMSRITDGVVIALTTVELAIHCLELRPFRVITSGRCILLLIVVLCTLLSTTAAVDPSATGATRLLRAARLCRVALLFKFIEASPELHRYVNLAVQAFKDSVVLLVILIVCLFIFACMGMQLYGGRWCDLAENGTGESVGGCANRPRSNFDSFGAAMLTSLQLMTADRWAEVMYSAMLRGTDWQAIIFVLNFFVTGCVVKNLFIAIIIATAARLENEEKGDAAPAEKAADDHLRAVNSITTAFSNQFTHTSAIDAANALQVAGNGTPSANAHSLEANGHGSMASRVPAPMDLPTPFASAAHRRRRLTFVSEMAFPPRGILQQYCRKAVENVWFQRFFLIVVVVATVVQTLDNPVWAPDDSRLAALVAVDATTTALFLCELLLNMMAYDLWWHATSFFRSLWNVLDLVLALLGLLYVSLRGAESTRVVLAYVRVLLPLRPLRIFRRSEGMNKVLTSMVRALPGIRNVAFLLLTVVLVWGTLGVQLFAGSLYTCSNSTIVEEVQCSQAGHAWTNNYLNFDSVPEAMTALYTVTTFSSWIELCHVVMDAVGPGQARRANAHPANAVYFIIFVTLVSAFLMNLFVSTLVTAYQKLGREAALRDGGGGVEGLVTSSAQQEWIACQRHLISHIPPPTVEIVAKHRPDDNAPVTGRFDIFRRRIVTLRAALVPIVLGRPFNYTTDALTLLNIVVDATDHYPASPAFLGFLDMFNDIFFCLFLAEVAFVLFVLGPKTYFSSRWRMFNTVVTLLPLVAYLDAFITGSRNGALNGARALRLLRMLRLVRVARGLRELLIKFAIAAVLLVHTAATMAIVCVIFALLNMQIYGALAWTSDLNRDANFADFIPSLNIVIRVATADEWPSIIRAASIAAPQCDPNIGSCPKFGGHASLFASVYFIVMSMITFIIILNVFIAVVVDSFHDAEQGLRASNRLTAKQASQFVVTFIRFDDSGLMKIPSERLPLFFSALPPNHPLGPPAPPFPWSKNLVMFRFLKALRIRECECGAVELYDVMAAVSRHHFNIPSVDEAHELSERLRATERAHPSTPQTARARFSFIDSITKRTEDFENHLRVLEERMVYRRYKLLVPRLFGTSSTKRRAVVKPSAKQSPTSNRFFANNDGDGSDDDSQRSTLRNTTHSFAASADTVHPAMYAHERIAVAIIARAWQRRMKLRRLQLRAETAMSPVMYAAIMRELQEVASSDWEPPTAAIHRRTVIERRRRLSSAARPVSSPPSVDDRQPHGAGYVEMTEGHGERAVEGSKGDRADIVQMLWQRTMNIHAGADGDDDDDDDADCVAQLHQSVSLTSPDLFDIAPRRDFPPRWPTNPSTTGVQRNAKMAQETAAPELVRGKAGMVLPPPGTELYAPGAFDAHADDDGGPSPAAANATIPAAKQLSAVGGVAPAAVASRNPLLSKKQTPSSVALPSAHPSSAVASSIDWDDL